MTIKVSSVQFGMDAEILLRTLEGHPFPVCGLFGGTKDKPLPIAEIIGKGYFVQEDNAACEFNIPPSHKISSVATSAEMAIKALARKLPESLVFDYENSSLVFNDEYLKIPQMQVFGCDPDYNAYTITANERPVPTVPGLRTAAAHVHVSWEHPTDEDRLEFVRLADVFAVLPTIQRQNSADARRRTLYGKAGAFRPKEYGIEHRVLSNSWIQTRMSTRDTLYNYTKAIAALNAGITVETKDYENIINAINKPHKKLASSLTNKYMEKFLQAVGPSWSWGAFFENFAS